MAAGAPKPLPAWATAAAAPKPAGKKVGRPKKEAASEAAPKPVNKPGGTGRKPGRPRKDAAQQEPVLAGPATPPKAAEGRGFAAVLSAPFTQDRLAPGPAGQTPTRKRALSAESADDEVCSPALACE